MAGGGSNTTTLPHHSGSDEPQPITRLFSTFGKTPPVTLLQETLSYATSPKNYLTLKLGSSALSSPSPLLCLPEEPLDRDLYGVGAHKQHFESHIAQLLGKAHGLFFITGVQAQLTAVKIYCDVKGSDRIAFHHLSHLETAEQRAYETVFGLQRSFIGKPRDVPTPKDVQALTSLPEGERPAVIVLEVPNRELGCSTYPWDDLVEISKLCKEANVKLHMDGARLWEVEPFYAHHYGKTFADIAALFDSVYVSFYKGLGGNAGAMLTSDDEDFINTAKTWQRRLGGNVVAAYQEVIDCERGYNLNIGTMAGKWRKMCSVVSAIQKSTAEYTTGGGGKIITFTPETPTCAQIHTHVQGFTVEELYAARDAVEEKFRIRVFERLRPWQNLDEQQNAKLVQRSYSKPEEGAVPVEGDAKEEEVKKHHYAEWVVNEQNVSIDDEKFAKGWGKLCRELVSGAN